MTRTIRPEPPVASRLAVLLRKVYTGEILIPRFQRPFVWSNDQRLLLMDSIYRGFPIGSLITWQTRGHELSTYPSLGGVPLPAAQQRQQGQQKDFKTYLLDGHQRLTTLYSALGPGLISADDPEATTRVEQARGDEPVEAIYFDLDLQAFTLAPARGPVPKTWIPLALLLDRYNLREFEDRQLSAQANARQLIYRVQDLLEVFSNYEVPVVSVTTEDLQEATRVFQRLNSTGVEINQFHMVNAKLWTPQFDLQEHVEVIKQQLEAHGWGQLSEQMILNTCKARLDLNLYDADVEAIAEQIQANPAVLEDTAQSLVQAAVFLRDHCEVEGPAVLPYSYQVVLLADAIARVGEIGPDAAAQLRRWFWVTTYAELFGGMNTSQLAKSLRHVREVAAGAADPLTLVGEQPIAPLKRFDFRAARSRAFVLAMARLHPQGADQQPLSALKLLAHDGVEVAPRLYSTRQLGDVNLSSRPENRMLCRPQDSAQVRAMLTTLEPIAAPASFYASHGFDEPTREALRSDDFEAVLRCRRASLLAIEREHVESIGLSYADDQ